MNINREQLLKNIELIQNRIDDLLSNKENILDNWNDNVAVTFNDKYLEIEKELTQLKKLI